MEINRRRFLGLTAALLPLTRGGHILAAELNTPWKLDVSGNIIPAPADPADWPEYRAALANWRREIHARLQYDGSLYRRPEFAWSSSNYACCFLMMCDETFYDRHTSRYRVDALLRHGEVEFGGYDSVVLWHAYPRIGVDQRNQFDFYRDMPGGLKGIRTAVRRFHKRNVRVYIDYNPWDTGTRRENDSDLECLASIVRDTETDGIFLDTLRGGAQSFVPGWMRCAPE